MEPFNFLHKNKKPYIKYDICGLNNIAITNNTVHFSLDSSKNYCYIEDMEFHLSPDNKINGMSVFLNEKTLIDDKIFCNINNLIESYLFNIIAELKADVHNFNYKINHIHNPNNQNRSEKPNTIIGIPPVSLSCKFIECQRIDKYKNILEKTIVNNNITDIHRLLLEIMKINNLSTRFLMQYQLLLTLVPTKQKSRPIQQDIVTYIKKIYNVEYPNNQLKIYKSKKPGSNADEDSITYYRNMVAHSDLIEIDEPKLSTEISIMSNEINHVIYHVLNNRLEYNI